MENPKTVYLAALVHGVRNKRETKSLLEKHFGKKLAEEALILSWNAKKKPATADEKILHDAELLDAFGAVGIARAYIKGGYKNQTLKETAKILEKNIKREFLTETGIELARDRLAFTRDFLGKLKKEV